MGAEKLQKFCRGQLRADKIEGVKGRGIDGGAC